LIETSSKRSAKRETDQDFLPVSIKDEKGRDDEDPLSFADASITIIGIILAIVTVSLPAISVFFERPLLQNKGLEINQFLNKDGY
tara:strand:- start:762 stop:1016 length:255 start_codon:yes stop_codon:yes gene_type:complete